MFLLAFAISATLTVTSCKKSSNIESPSIEAPEADDTFASYYKEDVEDETQIDPIGYEPESVTVTFTSAGGQAVAGDGDGSCSSAFKYVDYYKIGTAPVVLSLVTTDMSAVTGITNTNSKTGTSGDNSIIFTDKTNGVDTNHYSVKIAASSADFKQGSAKMAIAYTDKKGAAKVKNVTVKCVGKNASGKIFGTQAWGLMKEGVSSGNLTATGTTITVSGSTGAKNIASNYTPASGDVLVFSSALRGIVDSVIMKKDTATVSGTWHSKKYKIYTTMWNATDCKSTRQRFSQTLEVADFATKLYAKDKVTAATKFIQ